MAPSSPEKSSPWGSLPHPGSGKNLSGLERSVDRVVTNSHKDAQDHNASRGATPEKTARYYDINKDPGGAKSWGPSHEAPQPGAPPPGCHVARRNSRTAVQWPNPRQPQLRRNATSFEKLGLDARGCETTLPCPGRHAGISPETRTLVIGPSDDATSLVYVPFAQGTMVQALNGLFGRRSAPAISFMRILGLRKFGDGRWGAPEFEI